MGFNSGLKGLIDIPYSEDTNVIRNKAEKIINVKTI